MIRTSRETLKEIPPRIFKEKKSRSKYQKYIDTVTSRDGYSSFKSKNIKELYALKQAFRKTGRIEAQIVNSVVYAKLIDEPEADKAPVRKNRRKRKVG